MAEKTGPEAAVREIRRRTRRRYSTEEKIRIVLELANDYTPEARDTMTFGRLKSAKLGRLDSDTCWGNVTSALGEERAQRVFSALMDSLVEESPDFSKCGY